MTGKVNDGQLYTVEPLREQVLEVGDIVLCRANGSQYLHLVKASQGERLQIGNNRGGINGWVTRRFGRLIAVATSTLPARQEDRNFGEARRWRVNEHAPKSLADVTSSRSGVSVGSRSS
jgi:hypothetical protein